MENVNQIPIQSRVPCWGAGAGRARGPGRSGYDHCRRPGNWAAFAHLRGDLHCLRLALWPPPAQPRSWGFGRPRRDIPLASTRCWTRPRGHSLASFRTCCTPTRGPPRWGAPAHWAGAGMPRVNGPHRARVYRVGWSGVCVGVCVRVRVSGYMEIGREGDPSILPAFLSFFPGFKTLGIRSSSKR